MNDIIHLDWCGWCRKRAADGKATGTDGEGNILVIPLCNKCLNKLAPDISSYSIAK